MNIGGLYYLCNIQNIDVAYRMLLAGFSIKVFRPIRKYFEFYLQKKTINAELYIISGILFFEYKIIPRNKSPVL